jgi:hypothetical protein
VANLTDSVKAVALCNELKNNGSPTGINGLVIDTLGWNQATGLMELGVIDTTVDYKSQESADASTWADIVGKALPQISAAGGNQVYAIEVPRGTGTKRWVKFLPLVGNGSTGAHIAIVGLLSGYSTIVSDVAAADMGGVV